MATRYIIPHNRILVTIMTPVKQSLNDILSFQHSKQNRRLELTDANCSTAYTWLTIRDRPFTRTYSELRVCLSVRFV